MVFQVAVILMQGYFSPAFFLPGGVSFPWLRHSTHPTYSGSFAGGEGRDLRLPPAYAPPRHRGPRTIARRLRDLHGRHHGRPRATATRRREDRHA